MSFFLDKEGKIEALKKEKDALCNSMWFYKNYLKCHIQYEAPNDYIFRFTNNKMENEAAFVQFRTEDFSRWEGELSSNEYL